MKKTLLVFPLTTILALSIISTRQKNSGQDFVAGDPEVKTESIAPTVSASTALPARAEITVTDEEWAEFKKQAEVNIRSCQSSLSRLRADLITRKPDVFNTAGKKIEVIQAKLEFEQARLDAFGKSRVNWDVFEPGFNREMDAITAEIKSLSSLVTQ